MLQIGRMLSVSETGNPQIVRTKNTCPLLILMMQIALAYSAQFSSHISVNTPARSFSHGVGHPIGHGRNSGTYRQRNWQGGSRSLRNPVSLSGRGYPKIRPIVPFTSEDYPGNSLGITPWQYDSFHEMSIPLLPPSPYKVDSPDPESLWPEGLFLPPINAPRFTTNKFNRRSDNTLGEAASAEPEYVDPYLLEGSEAISAVQKSKSHGELYFHDIPHIESLLANQELRTANHLKPHRLASIRHTWPYNRP